MAVSPIPEGYHTVTPYLIVKGAAEAIDFYTKAFGAEEQMRLDGPDGKIAHVEIKIGDSLVMMADEVPDMGFLGPLTLGGSPVSMALYLEDVDAVFQQAVDAGAEVVRPLQDQFYGDRSGLLRDPFGHQWNLATHIEDVSPEELVERMSEMDPEE